ncbi:DUF2530 domain-containing protein [Tomitella gaofuii]|uniref:DUF2530 domain-containing protein n=1 Tax=Tomitella gaofuii TaxID=2760083 RepID=UPI0015FA99F3|nr:DUF2530 domain-containing protein [Tomitella gaofuii]
MTDEQPGAPDEPHAPRTAAAPTGADGARERPTLPAAALDPRPVVAAGFGAWIIATVLILATQGTSASALPVCYAGLVIGALGTAVFLVQRRGARSGRKGAQQGLA